MEGKMDIKKRLDDLVAKTKEAAQPLTDLAAKTKEAVQPLADLAAKAQNIINPPQPEIPDTATAEDDAKLARSFLDDAWNYWDKIDHISIDTINRAAHYIERARSKDPSVKVEKTYKKQTKMVSLDDMAGEALFLEANEYVRKGDFYANLSESHGFSRFSRYTRHGANLTSHARDVLLKAIAYQPDKPHYYRTLAQVYSRLYEREKAIEALQRALEISPHNIDTRKALDLYLENPRQGTEPGVVGWLKRTIASNADSR